MVYRFGVNIQIAYQALYAKSIHSREYRKKRLGTELSEARWMLVNTLNENDSVARMRKWNAISRNAKHTNAERVTERERERDKAKSRSAGQVKFNCAFELQIQNTRSEK